MTANLGRVVLGTWRGRCNVVSLLRGGRGQGTRVGRGAAKPSVAWADVRRLGELRNVADQQQVVVVDDQKTVSNRVWPRTITLLLCARCWVVRS